MADELDRLAKLKAERNEFARLYEEQKNRADMLVIELAAAIEERDLRRVEVYRLNQELRERELAGP
jgi:hypothetical protein